MNRILARSPQASQCLSYLRRAFWSGGGGASRAGTSSGKLFHYFPTKRAIVLAVVEDQLQETAAFLDTLSQQRDLSSSLLDFLDIILHLASSSDERRLVMETVAEAARDEDVRALNDAGDKLLAEGLTAILTEAIARGHADPIVPTEHAVRFLMMMTDGIFSRASVDTGFDPSRERASLRKILGETLRLSGSSGND